MDTNTLGLLYDTAKQQQQRLDKALVKLDGLSTATANATADAVAGKVVDQLDHVKTAADNAVSALNTARDDAESYERSSNLRSVAFFVVMLVIGLCVLFAVKSMMIPSYSEIKELKAQVQELERQGGRVDLIEIDDKLFIRVDDDRKKMYKTKNGHGVYAPALSK